MVFFSIFDCRGKYPKTIAGPGAIEVSRLGEVIPKKSLVVGDGYDAYLDQIPRDVMPLISRNPSLKDLPSTQTLIQHFELIKKNSPEITWKLLNPLYIRASAAEESIHKL